MSIGLWELRQTYAAYKMWMDDEISDKDFVDILHQLFLEEYENQKEGKGE